MDNNNFEALKAQYDHPQPKKTPNKKLRFVILTIIGVLVIAAIAIGVLLLVTPKDSAAPNVSSSEQTGGPAASDVVAQIAANETITNAANTYWQYRIDGTVASSDSNTSIIYKNSAYPFVTNVAPQDGIQFTKMDDATASLKANISSALSDTLAKAGFTETQQDVSQFTAAKVTTYTDKGTVCQLVNYDGALGLVEQSILCADSTAIQSSYSKTQSLLSQAGSSVAKDARTVIGKTVTDETKKLIDLTVVTSDASTALHYYFATKATGYQYLGSRTVGQVDDPKSYTVSDQLTKSLADPQWGTFLTDNIKV